jgi:hypothetical protein
VRFCADKGRVQAAMSFSAVPAVDTTPAVLTYTFNNTRPIELLDLTSSLLAIGEQFQEYAREKGEGTAGDDYRLYVREIRTGSIIIDLIAYATQPQMLAPLAPVLIDFTKELGDWFDLFKGVKDAKDIKEMVLGKSKKDLQLIANIVEPAAKDPGSGINIAAAAGAVIVVNSTINSTEANAGQNVLRRYIEHIKVPVTGIQRDKVLYWYQVRHDHAAKPGDQAVIEDIWKKPVKVRITSDEIKRKLLDDHANPFKKFYIVDVDVTTSQDRPILYKILEVKETIDREDAV